MLTENVVRDWLRDLLIQVSSAININLAKGHYIFLLRLSLSPKINVIKNLRQISNQLNFHDPWTLKVQLIIQNDKLKDCVSNVCYDILKNLSHLNLFIFT